MLALTGIKTGSDTAGFKGNIEFNPFTWSAPRGQISAVLVGPGSDLCDVSPVFHASRCFTSILDIDHVSSSHSDLGSTLCLSSLQLWFKRSLSSTCLPFAPSSALVELNALFFTWTQIIDSQLNSGAPCGHSWCVNSSAGAPESAGIVSDLIFSCVLLSESLLLKRRHHRSQKYG